MNTILIAEDDTKFAKILQKVFNENGFDTYLAEDGLEAIHLHQKRNPSILLMDIEMPQRNGWEVLEAVRKKDKTVPVVIMSGHKISEEDSLKSYELGAVTFIRKPFSPKEIVAHIQSLIKIKYDFDEIFVMDNISLNLSTNTLNVNNEECYLPERECKVLYLLAKNENKLVTYQEFIKHIWSSSDAVSNEQMLRNIITSLKKNLKKAGRIQITRIYGKGYILKITSK